MWGSDFPFVLAGGHEQNSFAVSYKDAVNIFGAWQRELQALSGASGVTLRSFGVTDDDIRDIMGGTARALFAGEREDPPRDEL